MIVKYSIKTLNDDIEIVVEGNWVIKAPEEYKWMEYKSFWYIKQEIEDHYGQVNKL